MLVPLRPVVGSYESENSKQVIEIGVRDGKVCLVVPGQPPYPLTESEKDKLRSPGLPEAYWIDVSRDGSGKVAGIVLNQPEGSVFISPFDEHQSDQRRRTYRQDDRCIWWRGKTGGNTALR
jgi:hypothetical protein